MNGITDPKDPYYIRPDLFKSTRKQGPVKTEERLCYYCELPFIAKWHCGIGPKHCSQACIKKALYKANKAWRKANPARANAFSKRWRAKQLQ